MVSCGSRIRVCPTRQGPSIAPALCHERLRNWHDLRASGTETKHVAMNRDNNFFARDRVTPNPRHDFASRFTLRWLWPTVLFLLACTRSASAQETIVWFDDLDN